MTTNDEYALPAKAQARVRALQIAANSAAAQATAAAAQVNEFLHGCALSLGVDLDAGDWAYDDRRGAFVRKPPPAAPAAKAAPAPAARPVAKHV